jgi:hypothetical protein
MKKNTLLLILSLVVGIIQAQTEKGTEKYLIKTDGTRVDFHPSKIDEMTRSAFELTNEKVMYFDTKGKQQSIQQSDVKEMVIGPDYYRLLPITKKNNRLLRVIATNNDHILSVYEYWSTDQGGFTNGVEYHLYIHNKQTLASAEDRIRYNNVSTNYENMLPTIRKYFASCTELLDKMAANSKKQQKEKKLDRKGPFEDISNLVCLQ